MPSAMREVLSGNLCRCTGYIPIVEAVLDARAAYQPKDPAASAAGTNETVNSLIGSPIERLEDLRFLRGRGEYVDDLAREGMLHAAILRSSVAHGRIRVDRRIAGARALPACTPSSPPKRSVPRSLTDACRASPCGCSRCRSSKPFGQPVIAQSQGPLCGRAARRGARGRAPRIAEDALGVDRG